MLAFYILVPTLILYGLLKVFYNLFFHPLAKFPGPKLAAATHLYEFYWSIVRDGEFIWQIERLHEQYGPIVRITPRELHINDPSFYNEIYAGNPKRVDGDYRFTRSTGLTNSMFSSVDHDLHQSRRNTLTKFFSRRSIANIQPIIQDKVERFIERLRDASRDGYPADLSKLSAAFAADTVSHYAYGVSMGCLDGEAQNIISDATSAIFTYSQWLRFMPIRFTHAKRLHPGLVRRIWPTGAMILETHRTIRSLALEVLNAKEPKAPHENIFAALVDPTLPAEERSLGRLEDEGFAVLGAGTETTAYSASVTMFYLLDNPHIFSKLYDEIKAVMPGPAECPPLSVLENLPLLRAVVNEGFRLSFGSMSRNPRISPDRILQYKDWAIPAGTPCSTSTYFVHTNPEIFPNPWVFDPWRWISAQEEGEHLESRLVNFTKGTRACIGLNLASAEMYMLTASLVRRVKMKLCEDTTIDCVTPARDHTIIVPKDTSGIKVMVLDVDTM
ncbi:cytochrome P450 [Xylaria grammica]|nr:cytochrome P450 [Xylaria grammica]